MTMTHEEQAHEAIVTFMEMIEVIDETVALAVVVTQLPFEDITPEFWEDLQGVQENNIALLETFKVMLSQAHKVVDNEALMNHCETVILAE